MMNKRELIVLCLLAAGGVMQDNNGRTLRWKHVPAPDGGGWEVP